ncbi:hypothetical protein [Blastomonas sp. SL216]|uniref:hypothetical protein n=1 Tax=Blastomonas sp. SL216 TaxID=2995169 RepID=UPI002377726F|nr:hypothetical protein OU999_06965 [Blastomonas sp. SL216]
MEHGIKSMLALTMIAAAINAPASAQSTTCGSALYQLQAYAGQVNQVANAELYQGIPMRCGYNAYCGNSQLLQLNQWYANQSYLINGWYQQLVSMCASTDDRNRKRRNPADSDIENGIDEESIEELEVDDEDRTVVLRIPSTPRGFSPR